MAIAELFTQLIARLEPTPAKVTKGDLEIEENEIAEEIEVENEEVNAVSDHLLKVIEGNQVKTELPTDLLAQFDRVQNLSLDAWAATTLRAYRG
jgi:predicted regulator of amino acid metabolism with ACT domain